MLSVMYSYAVLVREKTVLDFEKKRGEAGIIALPLFGTIGARMATSSLFTKSLIACFLSTFLWLKKVKKTDSFKAALGWLPQSLPLESSEPFHLQWLHLEPLGLCSRV